MNQISLGEISGSVARREILEPDLRAFDPPTASHLLPGGR